MKYYHIFRNRYERRLPTIFVSGCTASAHDYPEIQDRISMANLLQQSHRKGEPTYEAEVAELRARMELVSPTSPLRGGPQDDTPYVAGYRYPG